MKNKKNFLAKAFLVLIISLSGMHLCYPQSAKSFKLQTWDRSYIKCGSTPINFSKQTFEAWIKIISFWDSEKRVLFSNSTDCNVLISQSEIPGYYYIEYEIKAGNTWLKQKSKTPLSANRNSWYHLAATYDGYSLNIYINGINDNSTTVSSPTYNSIKPSSNYFIGKSTDTTLVNYSGYIDEIRLWSTAVSQSDIVYWMSTEPNNKHPNWNNLERYYKCDDDAVNQPPPAIVCGIAEEIHSLSACSYDIITYYPDIVQDTVYKKSTFFYGPVPLNEFSPKTIGIFFNNKIHQFSSIPGDPFVRAYKGSLDNQNNVIMNNSFLGIGQHYEYPGACCLYKDKLCYVSIFNPDEDPGHSRTATVYHHVGTLANDGDVTQSVTSRTMNTCVQPAYAVLNDTLFFFYITKKSGVIELDVDWSVDGLNWTFKRTVTKGLNGLDYYFGNVAACTSRDMYGKEVIYVGCVDTAHTAIQLFGFYTDLTYTVAFIKIPKVRNFSMVSGSVEGGFSGGSALQLFYSANTPDNFGNSNTIGRIQYSIDNQEAYAPEQLPITGCDYNGGVYEHQRYIPYAFSYYQTTGTSQETLGKKIILSVMTYPSSDFTQEYSCWNSDKMTYIASADVTDTDPGDKVSQLLGVIEGPPPYVLNGESLGDLIKYQQYPSSLEFGSSSSQANENAVTIDKSWSVSFRYYGIGGDFEKHAENTTQTDFSSRTYESRTVFPVEGRDKGYLLFLRPIITRKKFELTDASNRLLENIYTLEITDRFLDYVPYFLDTVAQSPNPKSLVSYINRSVNPGEYKKIYSANYSWTGGTKTEVGFETDSTVTKSTNESFYKGAGISVSIDIGFGEFVDVSTNVFDFESRIGTTTTHEGSTTLSSSKNIAALADCPFHGQTTDTAYFSATVYWIKPTDGKNNWWIPKGYENQKPWCITYKVNNLSLHPYSIDESKASTDLFDVYPNPANSYISFSIPNQDLKNQIIIIYNTLGVEIKRFDGKELLGRSSISFSTVDLPAGIYFSTLYTGTNKITKRFAVIR
jgi:hypothetical protein